MKQDKYTSAVYGHRIFWYEPTDVNAQPLFSMWNKLQMLTTSVNQKYKWHRRWHMSDDNQHQHQRLEIQFKSINMTVS